MNQYRVNTQSLNFRSQPEKNPANVLTILHKGQMVTKIAEVAENKSWWKVTVILDQEMTGYVARDFLRPVFPPAHLTENRKDITLNSGSQGYPLGAADRKERKATTPEARAQELTAIIEWLKVEESKRYAKNKKDTFCNIYAYDYCYLAGVYLAHVWWTPEMMKSLAMQDTVEVSQADVIYGKTVTELSANKLYDWLLEYAEDYGWTQAADVTRLQDSANRGEVCIISAKNRKAEQKFPGHICLVVPETAEQHAIRNPETGVVDIPLMSQAGWDNYKYMNDEQWWSMKCRHGRQFNNQFKFWIHI